MSPSQSCTYANRSNDAESNVLRSNVERLSDVVPVTCLNIISYFYMIQIRFISYQKIKFPGISPTIPLKEAFSSISI